MKFRTAHRSHNVVLEMEPQDAALPPVPLPELRLKSILVAVDFSACSRKALHYAISFARQFNAGLMLLHVVEWVPPQITAVDSARMEADLHETAAKQLAEWRREAVSKTSARAVVRNGASAWQEIVAAAEESNSDLIVVGNHGRGGLTRLLIGSTAERVVRHAPCPVLVVRETEHDFLAEPPAGSGLQSVQPPPGNPAPS